MIPKVISSSNSAALLPKTCPMFYQFCSVAQSCLTLCNPIDCSMPGFPVHHQLPGSLLKLMSIKSVMPSKHLILRCPLFLLISIFLSIRVFSNESALRMSGLSIGVAASASVLPMNTQDWSPLGWTGSIFLQSKGLSRVFSNTTVQKHSADPWMVKDVVPVCTSEFG